MTVFNRKTKVTERFDAMIDNKAAFQLSLRKLNIPEMLDAVNRLAKLDAAIKDSGGQVLEKELYDGLLNHMIDMIDGVYGLEDEDGIVIAWSSLTDNEKYEVLAMIDLNSIFDLWNKSAAVGRLKDTKKKV